MLFYCLIKRFQYDIVTVKEATPYIFLSQFPSDIRLTSSIRKSAVLVELVVAKKLILIVSPLQDVITLPQRGKEARREIERHLKRR